MKVDIVDRENRKKEEMNIDDAILATDVKDDLLHDVLLSYQQNSHTGSSNTLTRSEVRGGGKKPWKQKGTGRARHGSIRSPIWKGGGVVFGPKPVLSRIKINRESKKKVTAAVIARKIKGGAVIVIDDFEVKEPKTKIVASALKALNLYGKKLLIVTDKNSQIFSKATRNLRDVTVMTAKELNAYELMIHDRVLATKPGMEEMIRRIG
ncbi:MAG TPA: 50S ribosomal protein L4 [Candidatus Goldiibacteriota bacterium]|nr:50S ribosomal protein L4 [Candidatus Goldiibacteriota bacterium]